jgi:8-oxo-dGTP diphosphatase
MGREMSSQSRKALVVPVSPDGKVFIQDRRGYKAPDWGYFGGEIEGNETPLEAVIRESQEELSVTLRPSDIEYMGENSIVVNGTHYQRYFFLLQSDGADFIVREGRGGEWLTKEEALMRMEKVDRFPETVKMIKSKMRQKS